MTSEYSFDIGIVGACIAGLALAYSANNVGLKVWIFESNSQAKGSSIINFGLIWPIGRENSNIELSLRSKVTWLELSRRANFWHKVNGSIHLAYYKEECSVIEEFQNEYGTIYNTNLLTPSKAITTIGNSGNHNLLGALWSNIELKCNHHVKQYPDNLISCKS